MNRPIPIDLLTELLEYDTSSPSGLRWKTRGRGRRRNRVAGRDFNGYFQTRLGGTLYYNHRLIWALHYGDPGEMQIDHRDGDPSNVCLENLREATPATNARNMGSKGGTSKYLGVTLDSRTGRWISQITYQAERKYLGSFASEVEAAGAYDSAARSLHPGSRLNFPQPTDPNTTPAWLS